MLQKPLLYLDTNIFLDFIRNRTGELADSSKKLFREIEDDKYGVITSSFTSLEIMEDEQERVYAEREIFICRKSFDEVRRHIDRRDLTPSELAGIRKNLENRVYKPFMDKEKIILKYLTDDGWIRAYQLLDQLNIPASDCIHLAVADIAGCDVFVTNDDQLRSVASSFFGSDIMVFSNSSNIESSIELLIKARKEKVLEKKG